MLRENSFMFYEWKYFIPGSWNDISAKKLVCVDLTRKFEMFLSINRYVREISKMNIIFIERKHIWYFFCAKIEQKEKEPVY